MKRTLLSVKEVAQELVSYRISKMLRFELEPVQRIFLAKGLSTIVEPRGARSAALAADAHSSSAPVR